MSPFIVLLLAVVIVVSVVWSIRTKQRRAEAWERFAASRQLGWSRGQIAGVASGFTVALLIEERGSGKSRRDVAVVRCSLAGALPPEFGLEREGLGDKLVQLLGRTDHQLGFPEMDAAFLLQNLGSEARRTLSYRAVQETLLETVKAYPEMRIGKGVVQLETTEVPRTEEGLSRLLSDAISVANTLQRAKQRV